MAKIKFQIPRGLRLGVKKPASYHWWLIPEMPRKASRLPQLNRRNDRQLAVNTALRRLEGSANPEGAN